MTVPPAGVDPYASPPSEGWPVPRHGSGYGPPPAFTHPPPVPLLPPLADWGRRVGASLIDSLFSNWPMFIATVALLATLEEHRSRFEGEVLSWWFPSATGIVAYVVGYLISLALALWNRTFRQGRTGQSLGKQAVGVRLVADPTAAPFGPPPATPPALAPVGPLNAFVRDFVHLVDAYSYVGYLWPLWDAKRQTFADKIMKTVVVDARRGDPSDGPQSSRSATSRAAAPV